MRSIWRTADARLWRDVLAVAATASLVGASFGAIAVAAGMPVWLCCVTSLVVFAGGSQFMMVGILAAGGGPVAAVLAALVLNARHLPFGLAIGHLISDNRLGRLLGSHVLIDENTAFVLAERDPERARALYWVAGGCFFVLWNLGTLVGAYGGDQLGDPAAFGLDAAFPAAMFALLLPALRDRNTVRAVLLGGAIALAVTPLVPAGVPVLLALVGLLVVRRTPATKETVPA
ncbi:branched-chain amino acid ABC transporter permease [Pseudonocardiaceae bacterium YIM PH 21723]|nr:branched-chain amino acid ABC transporter permease [Pseudonocardiaceae bacterium YIM PH 21723]